MSALHEHIAGARAKGDGSYKLKDEKTAEEISLDFIGIHQPVRKLKENGKYFACTDFRRTGSTDQYYDVDFWMDEKTGKVTVNAVRVHKVPMLEDGNYVQMPRCFVRSEDVRRCSLMRGGSPGTRGTAGRRRIERVTSYSSAGPSSGVTAPHHHPTSICNRLPQIGSVRSRVYWKATPGRAPIAFKILASGQKPVNAAWKRLAPTNADSHNQFGL